MGRVQRILLIPVLLFFLFFFSNPETYLQQLDRGEKEYKALIEKCEKIEDSKKKIKCQKKFLKYFKYSQEISLKRGMIENLDPMIWSVVLREISETEYDYDLRHMALSQLNDQEKLFKIVNDRELDKKYRSSALYYLKKEEYLISIVKNDPDNSFRARAAEKIYGQDVLIGLVKTEKDKWMRNSAVQNLDDQETLKYLVLNDLYEGVREKAAGKIGEQQILKKVVMNDKKEEVQRAAVMNIDPELSSDFLKSISNHPSTHVKRIAQLKLIISNPEVKKLHGKLDFEYKIDYSSKGYGTNIIRSVKREFVTIKITGSKNDLILKRNYEGRDFQEKETFTAWKKILWATIDFDEIETELKKKKE